jgi:Fe-S cluster assembly iron-binding protein IscA
LISLPHNRLDVARHCLDLIDRRAAPLGDRSRRSDALARSEWTGGVAMLALSERAVTAIQGIVSNPQVPDGAGLRVAPQATGGDPVALELSLVEAPVGGDQVVENQGAQVFVDERISPMLDDKVLDATTEGEQVQFTIIDQGDASPT